MHKILQITLTCSLLGLKVIAQPILNASDINPIIGDVIQINNCSPTTMTPGAAGANQTWDLSYLISTGTTNHIMKTTVGSAFPSSSVKMESTGGNSYWTTSGSSLELSGLDGPAVFTYSDNQKYLNYPFQLGSTFTDTWANSFTSGVLFNRTGTDVVTADSYGTLILPNGTYSNVLRVKVISTYNDTSSLVTIGYTQTSYHYYKSGNHQPIASLASITIDGGTPQLFGYYLSSISTSLKDIDGHTIGNINISPNPSNDFIHINFNHNTSQQIEFILTDLTGKKISFIETMLSLTEYKIEPMVKLSGYYFLSTIENGHLVGTQKIQFIN